jgi:DNA-binding SARP family transcriptional activator/tetratricopeptide (TPR) repeat protein
VQTSLRYRVLGPVTAWGGEAWAAPPAAKIRTLLAVLVVNANQVVTVNALLSSLWKDRVPPTARKLVQVYVSRLRKDLPEGSLVTHGAGYELQVGSEQSDLAVFEKERRAGREALRAGRPAEAAAHLDTALALWHGPALADTVDSGPVRALAHRLEEYRSLAQQSWFDARLDLGQHAELVADLRTLVSEQPLREELWGRLMLALRGAGRQAEALAAYATARELLVGELGVEPGDELRRVHRDILTGAGTPAPELGPGHDPRPDDAHTEEHPGKASPNGGQPGQPAVPACQLPSELPDFVGRDAELRTARELLATAAGVALPDASPAVVPALVVTGPAGVGKTSLAVSLAHRLRASYPDGQLYTQLRTGAGPDADPAAVLGSFLRALGVPASEIPCTLAERAQLYRERLADRRVLVVLDDAADERQVRPLIPGTAGSAVLVTSRARLSGLEGARVLELEVLSRDAARELLGTLAGAERVRAEADAADRAIELCGRLPLALRIIGSRLAARRYWTLARLATALASERHRLDELTAGDLEVRASLQLSYCRLPAAVARAWRLLGTIDAPDFPSWWVPVLTGQPHADAEQVVEQLLDAHLLEVAPGGERYRFHELTRLFARECAEREELDEVRAAALARLVDTYRSVGRRSDARLGSSFLGEVLPADPLDALPPGLLDEALADPMAWFTAERATVLALIRQATSTADTAGTSVPAETWQLAASLATFLEIRGHLDDWRQSHVLALAAATGTGDVRAAAVLHRGLGELHTVQDRYADAMACFDKAAAGFAAIAEPPAGAAALSGLGLLHRLAGRHDTALDSFRRALALCRRSGNARGEVYAGSGMSLVYLEKGWLDEAEGCLLQALTLAHRIGYPAGVVGQLRALGLVHRGRGALAEAEASQREALALSAILGDRLGVAHARQWLGVLAADNGDRDTAARLFRECLATYRALESRFGHALTLYHLGDLHLSAGREEPARACLARATVLWDRIGCPYWQARTGDLLVTLAERSAGGTSAAASRAKVRELRRLANLPEPVPGMPDPYRPLSRTR